MSNANNNILIPLSIVLAGGMVATAVVLTQASSGGAPTVADNNQGQQQPDPTPTDVSYDIDGFASHGDADAPVTMVEYSDFACPFCKRFYDETKSQIISEYVEQGLVQFVRKDFIAVGGDRAAEAAHCAADQGAYWEYADILYANQTADRGSWEQADVHRGYAETLGLDADALVACFESREYQDKVTTSTQEGAQNGGSGTPFFVINDIPVSGAQPYNVFEQAIEHALENI